MKRFTALILAAAFTGAGAAGSATFKPNFAQTAKETTCKDLYKEVATCAINSDWSDATGWNVGANNCIDKNAAALGKCKAASAVYVAKEDRDLAGAPPKMGRPAYAIVGGITKGGQANAVVVVPKMDKKLRTINCGVCSKFAKKLNECALPVKNAGATPAAVLTSWFNSAATCITTQWDSVLFDACKIAPVNPLVANGNNQLTYFFGTPHLTINGLVENCPSVEARAKDTGVTWAKIQKGSFTFP